MNRRLIAAAALLLAAGAGIAAALRPAAAPTAHFIANGYPAHLSEWGVVGRAGGRLMLAGGVTPYDLATPLFTDYAGKLRTVWLPPGTSARYDATGTFDFPVGTVISKTFYYTKGEGDARVRETAGHEAENGAAGLDLSRVRLMETRILARREGGWVALPYVWNEDQTDAELMRAGTLVSLDLERADGRVQKLAYGVPNVNQCASCHVADHASRKFGPIGPKARHLNRDFAYVDGTENQLAHWARVGMLTGAPAPAAAPRNADWRNTAEPLNARARAYLDINCSHCHSAVGLARTTGLFLDAGTTEPRRLGVCKSPVAAGPGTGDRTFDVVPHAPDASIVAFRMASDRPGIRMPEAGRSLVHDDGVKLIRDWIASLDGACVMN